MATTRKNGLARRDELLDAALKCFGERGITEVGIEDIRKAAGASASSVYHQFEGLNGVIAALLKRVFERWYGYLEERVLEAKSAKAAVTSMVEAHLDWIHGHKAEARFMFQALALELAGSERKEIEKTKQALKARYVEHLGRLAKQDGLAMTAQQIELLGVAPANDACRRWCAGHAVDWEWMRKTLPAMAWKCVAPD